MAEERNRFLSIYGVFFFFFFFFQLKKSCETVFIGSRELKFGLNKEP
jgi:hypothetical protein